MLLWRSCCALLVLAVCGVALSSCLGQQQSSRLYVLTPLPRTERAGPDAGSRGLAIGVGPVELPQYTNRQQIVTGNQSYQLHPATFDEWAEPLRDNFLRVLADNLSILLATDRVMLFPWKGPMAIEYQVVVDVTQFLGEVDGETSLVALWSIVGKNGQEVLLSQKSNLRETTGPQGYTALAEAMSHSLGTLSREIAAAITTLAQPAPRR
jgi:uncharacterized protein